jgi:hypothetical protein
MATRATFNEEDFAKAIEAAINKHVTAKVAEIVEEAAEDAKQRVIDEVQESTAEIALKLLHEYEFRYQERHLVITVRNAKP